MDDEVRAFVVAAVYQSPSRIGYRMTIVGARSEDEAIGRGLRSLERMNPDGTFASPAALEVTRDRLIQVGASWVSTDPPAETDNSQ